MAAAQFRTQHPDPTTWTTADHETYDNLRRNDQHLAQTAQNNADRLRQLLAPAA
ncbi:hypothetical protein [Streptomyces sp. NPDC059783]|uniref:hypothetical protein n=1 Tax=Streptomyces sp. NPDC059783 TaxID=3346944 RepID=UPI0036466409